MEKDKPCFLCAFFKENQCTHTWRLTMHIEPCGGQVDFSTTPGMIPAHLEAKLTQYFTKFIEKVLPAIEKIPLWDEIVEWQKAHPDCEACPGREIRADLKPYLRLVKT